MKLCGAGICTFGTLIIGTLLPHLFNKSTSLRLGWKLIFCLDLSKGELVRHIKSTGNRKAWLVGCIGLGKGELYVLCSTYHLGHSHKHDCIAEEHSVGPVCRNGRHSEGPSIRQLSNWLYLRWITQLIATLRLYPTFYLCTSTTSWMWCT